MAREMNEEYGDSFIWIESIYNTKRCKNLEERLSKQTMEYYAKFDEQAVEIARLQRIIEQNIEGGYK